MTSLTHMQVYSHQVPGGMISNLEGQLSEQNTLDRLPEVLEGDPRGARRGRLLAALSRPCRRSSAPRRCRRAVGQALAHRARRDEGLSARPLRGRSRARLARNRRARAGRQEADERATTKLVAESFDDLRAEISDLAHSDEACCRTRSSRRPRARTSSHTGSAPSATCRHAGAGLPERADADHGKRSGQRSRQGHHRHGRSRATYRS